MKKVFCIFTTVFLLCSMIAPVLAANASSSASNDIKVEIISPSSIDSVPIYEGKIEINITNEGSSPYNKLLCYLTVVDIGRNQTYPVDEFGEDAYQTREIASLAPGESTTVLIPVRIMYVGEFRFTASVIDCNTGAVTTGNALSVTMTATSNLNKTLVMIVAAIVPFVLLCITLLLTKKRGKKKT